MRRFGRKAILGNALLVGCGLLWFWRGSGSDVPSEEGRDAVDTENLPSQRAKKEDRRTSPSNIREQLLAADWIKRKDLFQDALEDQDVPLDELWKVFDELNQRPGEKFGVASLAFELFAAFGKRDPAAGLKHLESLDAGVVRRQALRGFARGIPADLVPLLVESVKAHGFPDEEISQIALSLNVDRFTPEDLKRMVDARYFDDQLQRDLGWLYRSEAGDTATLRKHGDSPAKPNPPVVYKDNGTAVAEESTPPPASPALQAFNFQLSKDRFGAAEGLQRGVFDGEILSDQLVKNVSRHLVVDDPARALKWAGNWEDAKVREASIRAVVWSWVRSDPKQSTAAVNGIEDPQVKDIAAVEVVDYLISHKSFDEAAAWVDGIADPVRKKAVQERMAGARE
jgi:hypothetical protein